MGSVNDFLSFKDWIKTKEHKNKEWTIVARHQQNELNDFRTFSALATHDDEDNNLKQILSKHHWEIGRIGDPLDFGKPDHDLENDVLVYYSGQVNYINDMMFCPLVIYRKNPVNKIETYELTQEFILFHDAYLDPEKGEYYKENEDGEIELIARICNEEDNHLIEVRTHMIRDFLASKGCILVRYHDHRRKSPHLVEYQMENGYEKDEIKGNLYVFELTKVCPAKWYWPDFKSRSTILGKDVVMPYTKPLEYHRRKITGDVKKEYESFIIGMDEQGNEILATCDKTELDKQGKTSYLSSVFFKKDVLLKYYQASSRYEVGDGYVSHSKWILEIAINDEGLVQAYLGDMGNIPYKEQKYWRTFNVAPRGGMTEERFLRDFMNIPAEPANNPVYQFKKEYELVQKETLRVLKKPIFRKLRKEDKHRFASLRLPLNEEWNEYEQQIQSLAIITCDSIDIDLLRNAINLPTEELKDLKSIQLLAKFLSLESIGESNISVVTFGLHLVQDLRSSSTSHRKGSVFYNYLKKYNLEGLKRTEILGRVYSELTKSLSILRLVIEGLGS